ncbi:hypothetical protein Sru01_18580 [Sphaerisporangium rufum]|uniref:Chorismate mutase domain-containing protein n=2 Tax=Sphaerisporangium rufum TaxID=1381558 RepID=A0A919R1W3_9ACTN|nr:hypothetical protein Sru01_18580 [Sphaerisporangium rufum]
MSSTVQTVAHTVRVRSVTLGDGPVLVVAGAGGSPDGDRADGGPGPAGADVRWLAPRPGRAAAELAAARAGRDVPVLAEPATDADLPAVAAGADGVVVGAAWARDPARLAAAARLGLPVVLQRPPGADLAEWLELAARCAGAAGVALCEPGEGTAGEPPAADLGLAAAARERSGLPVLAAPGTRLAAATVAAGMDGLWLPAGAGEAEAAAAREAATLVGALLRPQSPATLASARGAIDRVDAALAVLLERRAALAGTVQRLKPVGGFAGRDAERERRLVAAMARRAPRLGEARLAPIMNAVIEAGLRLSEDAPAAGPRPRG